MEHAAHRFVHLPPATGRLGAVFSRPQRVAAACVLSLAALGWTLLGLLALEMRDAGDLPRALVAFCRTQPQTAAGMTGALLTLAMWTAMILAMMLPSAAPMISTYAEIADTAARKGERIVSPWVIAAGYGISWLGFAIVATLMQAMLASVVPSAAGRVASGGWPLGLTFVIAGLYQFTALKHACLAQCRRPFPFFLTQWQSTARGVLALGLQQGLYCVGCCWALMTLMLAVGAMNVLWMAALSVVMILEKTWGGRRFSRALGAGLVAVGLVAIAGAVAGLWASE
jgi:predicted metal-binding membrane protein